MAEPEVVVTGVGAVSPFGWGVDSLWNGLTSFETAICELELFDVTTQRTKVAGAVPDVPPRGLHSGWIAPAKTRVEQFAFGAVGDALAQANLTNHALESSSVGVFWGSSTGGMLEGEDEFLGSTGAGRRARLVRQPIGAAASALARQYRLRGAVETISSACCASTMSVEAAAMSIRSGEHDVVITGGADSLCRVTYSGFNSLRAVSEEAARPFRSERTGLSLGEGAGALVLESRTHAEQRGARILARLSGAASSCDAYHMTAPDPAGEGVLGAMDQAVNSASLQPNQVGAIIAHGTGTPHNDAAESAALARYFGDRASIPPVLAAKGAIGHLLGAAGGIEAVIAVLCLHHGQVPASVGHGELDPEASVPIGFEPGAHQALVYPSVLSINLAFGGANSALLFTALESR